MTTDCKEEMRNCISKYKEELAENKAAIRQTLTSDKINISDYFYQGDTICNEELFNVGGECQDTQRGKYTYDEWKQKIEKSKANELLEPVHNLLRSKAVKARTTICRLVLSLRSQFFHNRLHFSSQAKERSTTHLFGNTTKVCNSLRFITSTVAPIVVFI